MFVWLVFEAVFDIISVISQRQVHIFKLPTYSFFTAFLHIFFAAARVPYHGFFDSFSFHTTDFSNAIGYFFSSPWSNFYQQWARNETCCNDYHHCSEKCWKTWKHWRRWCFLSASPTRRGAGRDLGCRLTDSKTQIGSNPFLRLIIVVASRYSFSLFLLTVVSEMVFRKSSQWLWKNIVPSACKKKTDRHSSCRRLKKDIWPVLCLTHSHTMTPFDAPGKQAFWKHCGKRRNCS